MQIIPASSSPFLSFGVATSSPQPTTGLRFNAPGQAAAQRVELPIIASSTGYTLAFWLKKNTSFAAEATANGGPVPYQWLFTTRPDTEEYFTTVDVLANLIPYTVNGTARTGSLLTEVTGTAFNRLVFFIPGPVAAGKITMLSSPNASQQMWDALLSDVMIYTGAWTAAQLADPYAGHTTNLLHRYAMAAGTTGTSVPDSLGNGSGVLFNF